MLKNIEHIEQWLKNYKINKYHINEDMSVDVHQDVKLSHGLEKLITIPIQFKNVFGFFDCSYQKLISLKGCPEYVAKDFDCGYNQLTSLQYCPKIVGGTFYANNNQLISLACELQEVQKSFYCVNNPLTSLKGLQAYIKKYLICEDSLIENLIIEELLQVNEKIFISHLDGKKLQYFENNYNSDNTLIMDIEDIRKILLFQKMTDNFDKKNKKNSSKI